RHGVAGALSWDKPAALKTGEIWLSPKLPGVTIFYVPDGRVTEPPERGLDAGFAFIQVFERRARALHHFLEGHGALNQDLGFARQRATGFLGSLGDQRLGCAADINAEPGAPSFACLFDRPSGAFGDFGIYPCLLIKSELLSAAHLVLPHRSAPFFVVLRLFTNVHKACKPPIGGCIWFTHICKNRRRR